MKIDLNPPAKFLYTLSTHEDVQKLRFSDVALRHFHVLFSVEGTVKESAFCNLSRFNCSPFDSEEVKFLISGTLLDWKQFIEYRSLKLESPISRQVGNQFMLIFENLGLSPMFQEFKKIPMSDIQGIDDTFYLEHV